MAGSRKVQEQLREVRAEFDRANLAAAHAGLAGWADAELMQAEARAARVRLEEEAAAALEVLPRRSVERWSGVRV